MHVVLHMYTGTMCLIIHMYAHILLDNACCVRMYTCTMCLIIHTYMHIKLDIHAIYAYMYNVLDYIHMDVHVHTQL
jgi:hypothetical protein